MVLERSTGEGAAVGRARAPLDGVRVVVTRTRDQAGALVREIEGAGGEACVYPSIRIAEPDWPERLRAAARRLSAYDWVVFTSVNGVRRFWAALEDGGVEAGGLEGVRVAAVGPSTAAALERRGVTVDLMPRRYVAESLLAAMREACAGGPGGASLAGVRVLLPVASGARPVLERGLRAAGARVDRVDAYRTVPDFEGGQQLRRRLERGDIDAITFTSPSTVSSFVAAVGREVGAAVVAVIGPVTAAAAREAGLSVGVEAREHTIAGLVRALGEHFVREPRRARGV